MEISEQGKAFIQARETYTLEPHWDPIGKVWDIGYGHVLTPGEPRVAMTKVEVDALFVVDSLYYADHVTELVTAEIAQPMFDAMASFVYNCGHEALHGSTMLQYLNAAMWSDVVVELLGWNKSRGAFVNGLLNRRAREALMFSKGEYWI